MLAAVYLGPDQLEVRDVPAPTCPPGGALLAVEACAVCGTDVRIVRQGHRLVQPPRIIGHEVAGTIIASDAPGVVVGQRVTVAPAVGCGACAACISARPNRCPTLRTIGYAWEGGFAEQMAVPAEAVAQGNVCAIPDGLSAAEACLAEPLACCLNGQELLGVGPGDRVIIAGAGPIGALHARLARARGAAEVVIVEPNPMRRAQAERLGLGHGVAAAEECDAAVDGEMTVAIVAASVPALYQEAPTWVAPGGRVSLFAGLPPDSAELVMPANLVHYRELTLVGAHGSTPAQNRAALELIASGALRVDDLITARFPLAHCAAAVAEAAAGRGLKTLVSLP